MKFKTRSSSNIAQPILDISGEAFVLVDHEYLICNFNQSAVESLGNIRIGESLHDHVAIHQEILPTKKNPVSIHPMISTSKDEPVQLTISRLNEELFIVKISPTLHTSLVSESIPQHSELTLDLIVSILILVNSKFSNIDNFIKTFTREIGASSLTIYKYVPTNDNYHEIHSHRPDPYAWNDEIPAQWVLDLPMVWKNDEYDLTHPAITVENKDKFPLVITTAFQEKNQDDRYLIVSAFQQKMLEKSVFNKYWVLHQFLTKFVDFKSAKIKDADGTLELFHQTGSPDDDIIQVVRDGMIIVNQKMEVIDINPAAKRILGYGNIDLLNQKFNQVVVGSPEVFNVIQFALDGNATQDEETRILYQRDGTPVSVSIQAIPIPGEAGSRNSLFVFRDMTEYEQFIEQTRKLEQKAVLGDYMAVFAHEVRNPINNISTGLQLLNAQQHSSKTKNLIQRLLDDCDRLIELAESTLNEVRNVEPDRISLAGEVDLISLLDRITSKWSARLQNNRVQLVKLVDVDEAVIRGEYSSLERAFNNIISNAFEAMRNSRGDKVLTIRLCLVELDGQKSVIQLDFSDTGLGIPDDIRDRIFDPFFTATKGGTGLGLPITKQIITAHQGNIQAISIPGATVFRIHLPYTKDEGNQA